MSHFDQYSLETPENIEVHFDIAGIGSRFCALLVDHLLLGLMAVALVVVALIVDIPLLSDAGTRRAAEWITAAIAALIFALFSCGYFVLFEWLMRGQTPGKKAIKIRVIRDDGTPVTFYEVMVRNILRLIDFLPGFYGVGVLVMFPNRLSKRLGDIAAGTIVVKEGKLDYSARADRNFALRVEALDNVNAELTAAERRLIGGFLQRRSELLPQARDALAERLARPLFEKYRGEFRNAEDYLIRLAQGKHHES